MIRKYIIPIFVILLAGLIPSEAASNVSNTEEVVKYDKIKFIDQVFRKQLAAKKADIQEEDVCRKVAERMPVDVFDPTSADELQKRKHMREARSLYPVFVLGDFLAVRGTDGTVTGRFNRKNAEAFWVGKKKILTIIKSHSSVRIPLASPKYHHPEFKMHYKG